MKRWKVYGCAAVFLLLTAAVIAGMTQGVRR